ncbi:hypothetical protein AB0J52_15365 [Spirillospora sp. NPDC049652]
MGKGAPARILTRTAAGILGADVASGVLAGPADATTAAPAQVRAEGGKVVLDIAWEREQKEWWCGSPAARMALKSWGRQPATQPHLADEMVTR